MITEGISPSVFSLRRSPLAVRLLLSAFLATIGMGYLAAMMLLYISDVDPHRRMNMGMVEGIVMKYRGQPNASRLEGALNGSMSDRIKETDRTELLRWVRAGASADGYARVRPLFEANCIACHSPASGLPVPSLATFQDLAKLTQIDTGPSVGQLARVSHIHLFGISIIFLLTGAIFALGETPMVFRAVFVSIPYVAIWVDIGAWWLTKQEPIFGYFIVAGGALMGLGLATQILVSFWEMWLVRTEVVPRG